MADQLSVVIVDDSRSVLARFERLIAEADGVELVGTAADGASALRVIKESAPDLVLMDIVMPGMDGLTALRMLQATQPEVRVVMVSSVGGSVSRAEEAFKLGAVQVIGKPVDPETLRALLESERELQSGQAADPS